MIAHVRLTTNNKHLKVLHNNYRSSNLHLFRPATEDQSSHGPSGKVTTDLHGQEEINK